MRQTSTPAAACSLLRVLPAPASAHLAMRTILHSTLQTQLAGAAGTIGQTLAGRVGHVIGIDNVASAIEDAAANAAINGITNVEYVCGNAEAVLGRLLKVRMPGSGVGRFD